MRILALTKLVTQSSVEEATFAQNNIKMKKKEGIATKYKYLHESRKTFIIFIASRKWTVLEAKRLVRYTPSPNMFSANNLLVVPIFYLVNMLLRTMKSVWYETAWSAEPM